MPLADSAVGAAQTLTRSSPKSVLNHRAGPSPAPRAGSSARVTAAPGRRPVRRTFRRGAPSSGSWLLLFLPRDSATCRFRHTSQARKISAEPCSLAALTQRSEAGSEADGHFQGRNIFPSLQPGVSVHPLSSLSSKRVARTAPFPHCARPLRACKSPRYCSRRQLSSGSRPDQRHTKSLCKVSHSRMTLSPGRM